VSKPWSNVALVGFSFYFMLAELFGWPTRGISTARERIKRRVTALEDNGLLLARNKSSPSHERGLIGWPVILGRRLFGNECAGQAFAAPDYRLVSTTCPTGSIGPCHNMRPCG
jgi:hypothetical protein